MYIPIFQLSCLLSIIFALVPFHFVPFSHFLFFSPTHKGSEIMTSSHHKSSFFLLPRTLKSQETFFLLPLVPLYFNFEIRFRVLDLSITPPPRNATWLLEVFSPLYCPCFPPRQDFYLCTIDPEMPPLLQTVPLSASLILISKLFRPYLCETFFRFCIVKVMFLLFFLGYSLSN